MQSATVHNRAFCWCCWSDSGTLFVDVAGVIQECSFFILWRASRKGWESMFHFVEKEMANCTKQTHWAMIDKIWLCSCNSILTEWTTGLSESCSTICTVHSLLSVFVIWHLGYTMFVLCRTEPCTLQPPQSFQKVPKLWEECACEVVSFRVFLTSLYNWFYNKHMFSDVINVVPIITYKIKMYLPKKKCF